MRNYELGDMKLNKEKNIFLNYMKINKTTIQEFNYTNKTPAN